MLVLTRHEYESVIITLPDSTVIRVSVQEIHNARVRLGFEAPAHIAIHREELLREIKPPTERTP